MIARMAVLEGMSVKQGEVMDVSNKKRFVSQEATAQTTLHCLRDLAAEKCFAILAPNEDA